MPPPHSVRDCVQAAPSLEANATSVRVASDSATVRTIRESPRIGASASSSSSSRSSSESANGSISQALAQCPLRGRNRRESGAGGAGGQRARHVHRARERQFEPLLRRLARRREPEAVAGHRDADADARLARELDALDATAADAELFRRSLDPTRFNVLAAGRRAGSELAQERQWRQPARCSACRGHAEQVDDEDQGGVAGDRRVAARAVAERGRDDQLASPADAHARRGPRPSP